MLFLAETLAGIEANFSFAARAHLAEETMARVNDFNEHFASRYVASAAVMAALWFPSLLLIPFLAFFMLRDGWRFKRFISRSVPNAFFERTLFLLDQLDRTARGYFQGLIKLTVLDALCLAAGLSFIGVSSPLLLGLLTAILAWIPYVGSIGGCLLVVLVAATDYPGNPSVAYAAIGLFIAVRMLDDFVFMPMTIGKSLKMHPLLTVLMIFAGGAVAGVGAAAARDRDGCRRNAGSDSFRSALACAPSLCESATAGEGDAGPAHLSRRRARTIWPALRPICSM
jgi:predicted PurR-regulated permease PerM